MEISWLGHSCFRLVESTKTTIITDPFAEKLVGYSMPKVKSDAVTVSHSHSDHNFVSGIDGSPVVFDKAGVYDFKGVEITAIPSYHDELQGAKRGANLIFKYRLDGINVCHMGDIGEKCTLELADKIMPVNILLIPVGGVYTIDAKSAKEYISVLMPEVVIPMHYKTPDAKIEVAKLDEFLDLFDEDMIVYCESDTIEFERDDFDVPSAKIYIPKRLRG